MTEIKYKEWQVYKSKDKYKEDMTFEILAISNNRKDICYKRSDTFMNWEEFDECCFTRLSTFIKRIQRNNMELIK